MADRLADSHRRRQLLLEWSNSLAKLRRPESGNLAGAASAGNQTWRSRRWSAWRAHTGYTSESGSNHAPDRVT